MFLLKLAHSFAYRSVASQNSGWPAGPGAELVVLMRTPIDPLYTGVGISKEKPAWAAPEGSQLDSQSGFWAMTSPVWEQTDHEDSAQNRLATGDPTCAVPRG